MREDLLREISEIKRDLKGLNDRLERVTDVLLQEDNVVDNTPISLEKGNQTEGISNNFNPESFNPKPFNPQSFNPQPIPINNTFLPNSETSTPLSDFIGQNQFQQSTPISNFAPIKKERKVSDLETNLGKNVMSVLASILIFIGLISFVAFVFTDLSEMLKMGLMFLFSFGLFGVGLWRVEKNKNAFSLGLSSCGIGAVFISILLSCFYFEFITNEFLLFGLLVGWSIIGLILSRRYRSDLFVIISYIGFYIALLLGAFSGMYLFGEEVCTSAVMVILHSVFIYLVSSNKLNISKKLYTAFPFISLLGSFILICYVLCLDWRSESIFEFHSLLLTISMLIQMGVSLFYVFKLQKFRLPQYLVTTVLLITCCVNILGMLSTSLDYKAPLKADNYFSYNSPYLFSIFDRFGDEYEGYDAPFEDYVEEDSIGDGYLGIESNGELMSAVAVDNEHYIGLSMIFAAFVHILFIEWSRKKLWLKDDEHQCYNTMRYVGLFSLSIFSALILCIDPMNEYLITLLGLIIPAGLLLWYGKNDKHLFKLSQIIYFIGLFVGCTHHSIYFLEDYLWAFILFSLLNIVYLVYSGIILKKHYKLSNKVLYYFVGLFSILFLTNIFADYLSNVTADMYRMSYEKSLEGLIFIQAPQEYYELPIWQFLEYDLALFINFIVLTILGLFVKLSNFCQNWNHVIGLRKSENEKLDVVYNLNNGLNCILLFMGVSLIHSVEIGVVQFICILLSSLLCFIGSRELLSRNNRVLEYYVGIKATLFINLVMGAFVDSGLGYIYSIVCLLIAISSIIIGFAQELKSFRLYGLILSICSVLKLVLIDISYDNSLGRIFSFIISGLLCFAIVWIYNKMSEKLNK